MFHVPYINKMCKLFFKKKNKEMQPSVFADLKQNTSN